MGLVRVRNESLLLRAARHFLHLNKFRLCVQ
nr:MAG TPA: hypothetical protein [Caudoviricetes sp.]